MPEEITVRELRYKIQTRGYRVGEVTLLKCKTVNGVLLVYNVVRSVACEAAKARGEAPDRVSVTDTVRWLVGVEGDDDLSVILTVPKRTGRVKPRVKKRRPKQYARMTKPLAYYINS